MAYSEKAKALRQCKALRKGGKPCQAYAVWGENFCTAHSGRHHRGLMPHPYERRFKRLSRQSPTCHCPAYNWPHRPGGIAQDKYDKKATELKQRQYELTDRLRKVTEADEDYSITLIT
ncbi:MAG: hypothetical protein H8E13_03565, partial [Actinobacteria bacterium]|nr:hypothetical protein [Actinomycetota bacterium]